MSPHIVKASYTGARAKGQSAARLARYIEERRSQSEGRGESNGHEQERNQERDRYEKATTFGNREEFVAAAKERSQEGRRSSYVHVILSPQEGREFTDRDFEKLVKPWTQDRHGNEKEYFAAVHRDSEHPHLHVAVARDKFQKEELADLKSQTHERIRGRERFHEGARQENERDQEREQSRDQDERETARERQSGGGSDLGRFARQGMRETRYIGTTIARKAAREIQNELGGNDHTQVQWGGYGQNGPSRLKVRIGDRSVEVYGGHDQSKREMMERAQEGFHQMREDELRDREQQAFYAERDRQLEEAKERRKEIDRELGQLIDEENDGTLHRRGYDAALEREWEETWDHMMREERESEERQPRRSVETEPSRAEEHTQEQRDTREESPEGVERDHEQESVREERGYDDREGNDRDVDERESEELERDLEEREESSAEVERDEESEDEREDEQDSEEREAEEQDYVEADLDQLQQDNSLQQNNLNAPGEGPGHGLQGPGRPGQGAQEQSPSQDRGGNERGGGSGDRSR